MNQLNINILQRNFVKTQQMLFNEHVVDKSFQIAAKKGKSKKHRGYRKKRQHYRTIHLNSDHECQTHQDPFNKIHDSDSNRSVQAPVFISVSCLSTPHSLLYMSL